MGVALVGGVKREGEAGTLERFGEDCLLLGLK